MAKVVKFRRNNTAGLAGVTGQEAELFVDTDKKTVVVMDGLTAGGFPLARESALNALNTSLTSSITALNSSITYTLNTNISTLSSNIQTLSSNLGTMAWQSSSNVNIIGGAISSTTINTFVVGSNCVGRRTIQPTGSVPTGGSSGDIVYQY